MAVQITCQQCGKLFNTRPSLVGKRKYCSKRDKFQCIVMSNPDLKLEIINRDSFKQLLGINVDQEAKKVS